MTLALVPGDLLTAVVPKKAHLLAMFERLRWRYEIWVSEEWSWCITRRYSLDER
jgi:hypothetical protein